MADSIRKQILKNIETVLLGITAIKSVRFGTFEPTSLTKPAVGFRAMDDDTDIADYSINNQTMVLSVKIVADAGNEQAGFEVEDLIPLVHEALMADRKRGTFARRTRLEVIRDMFNDKDFPEAGVEMRYRIEYATDIIDLTIQK